MAFRILLSRGNTLVRHHHHHHRKTGLLGLLSRCLASGSGSINNNSNSNGRRRNCYFCTLSEGGDDHACRYHADDYKPAGTISFFLNPKATYTFQSITMAEIEDPGQNEEIIHMAQFAVNEHNAIAKAKAKEAAKGDEDGDGKKQLRFVEVLAASVECRRGKAKFYITLHAIDPTCAFIKCYHASVSVSPSSSSGGALTLSNFYPLNSTCPMDHLMGGFPVEG